MTGRLPKPLPADEKVLTEYWHGRESARDVASALGITVTELDNAWRRLKIERKLPNRSRRILTDNTSDHHDGRKRVDEYGGEDGLLEALRAQHPEKDPERHHDA